MSEVPLYSYSLVGRCLPATGSRRSSARALRGGFARGSREDTADVGAMGLALEPLVWYISQPGVEDTLQTLEPLAGHQGRSRGTSPGEAVSPNTDETNRARNSLIF